MKFDLEKDIQHYRTCLDFLGGNVPIEVLCLPPKIESILIKEGCTRVYDLTFEGLKEIKGIGERRAAIIADRLDAFLGIGM